MQISITHVPVEVPESSQPSVIAGRSPETVSMEGNGVRRPAFLSLLVQMERMEGRVRHLMNRVMAGRQLSPQELVSIQSLVLAHARMGELFARIVEVVRSDLEKLERSVR